MHTATISGQPVAQHVVPSPDADMLDTWQEQVRGAARSARPMAIVGGGTERQSAAMPADAVILSTMAWSGIVHHDPSEAIVTVRTGTTVADLATALRGHGQKLPFDPPQFGNSTTIGGTVARGLAGPARPFAGAVRDAVLGVRLIDGQGRRASFGGAVLKNVAGFDVPRLMTGARGTLGILTEVTLRLAPIPATEITVRRTMTQDQAIDRLNALRGLPLPVSAGAWADGVLHVRLSGAPTSVSRAVPLVGGDVMPDAGAQSFWNAIRDQRLAAMLPAPDDILWRLSVRADAPAIDAPVVVDWAGWVRWVRAPIGTDLHAWAARHGGFARAMGHGTVPELPSAVAGIHRRLRAVFDPARILNPHIRFGEAAA